MFQLDTSIPGWKGEIELAATAGKGIPFDHEFRREADFVLDRAEQVVGLHEADPGRRDLHWRGPEDLSVQAWLGVSEHDLLLKVVVTDDRNPLDIAETGHLDHLIARAISGGADPLAVYWVAGSSLPKS